MIASVAPPPGVPAFSPPPPYKDEPEAEPTVQPEPDFDNNLPDELDLDIVADSNLVLIDDADDADDDLAEEEEEAPRIRILAEDAAEQLRKQEEENQTAAAAKAEDERIKRGERRKAEAKKRAQEMKKRAQPELRQQTAQGDASGSGAGWLNGVLPPAHAPFKGQVYSIILPKNHCMILSDGTFSTGGKPRCSVIGFKDENDSCPAWDAGIKIGSIILKVDDSEVFGEAEIEQLVDDRYNQDVKTVEFCFFFSEMTELAMKTLEFNWDSSWSVDQDILMDKTMSKVAHTAQPPLPEYHEMLSGHELQMYSCELIVKALDDLDQLSQGNSSAIQSAKGAFSHVRHFSIISGPFDKKMQNLPLISVIFKLKKSPEIMLKMTGLSPWVTEEECPTPKCGTWEEWVVWGRGDQTTHHFR